MKELIKTSRTAGYLEKMFRTINADLFNGEIIEPVITIQSTPTAYGHCTVAKVWRAKENERHELNMGAETLNRPIENVVSTLIHEMVHLLNMQRGIQDTSRGNSYHNKRFKEEAEKHLIRIEHDKTYGWTVTSPTEELMEYIINKGWEDIQMNRGYSFSGRIGTDGNGNGSTGTTPKPSSTRKYKCPCCGNSVRATKEVRIMCMDCNKEMQKV